MNAAFFHDVPLIQGTDEQFYSIGFTYNIWQRYLEVFDSIVVSTRVNIDNPNDSMARNMKISSGIGVEFKPITKYKKNRDAIFNKEAIKDQIRETLKIVDCAIIRLPSMIGNIACNEARKLEIPYLIELVGCPWDALWNHSIKGKLVAPFMYFKTKNNVKDASYVVYVTNDFLQKRYPTVGKQISCSNVSIEELDEKILDNRLNIIKNRETENKMIIGTTAALNVRYKGQQYVIEALGRLKQKSITNFEYHLVGGGDQTYLKSIAKKYDVIDQVEFLGAKPNEEVIKWLDSIDIYIQPSMTEGLPRALIEAMSRGLPSIGSNAGGIPELINNDYIFNIKGLASEEIANILLDLNSKEMKKQAMNNFKESEKYCEQAIESRRISFFERFICDQN